MQTVEVENFNAALKDKGVQFKFLNVDDYMETIKIIKKIETFVSDRAKEINTLIEEYNKEYKEKVKSPEYKTAFEKQLKSEKLTVEEEQLVNLRPPVVVYPDGRVSGPTDFIEKINKIREAKLSLKKLNFISDKKIFKSVVENATIESQSVLFEYLFKQ